ncbi:hypothetical protein IT408_00400 [Candidatus Uhrbacteria bacterium]|nr:hypothetical protein [Candidatus Uhrbacteria bacterium]
MTRNNAFVAIGLGLTLVCTPKESFAAVQTKAIYAAPRNLPEFIEPGKSAEIQIHIDRKFLRSPWVRIRVAPTPGVTIQKLPTWTKSNDISFRLTVSKTIKVQDAQINLSITQSGLTARLPLAFKIGKTKPTVPEQKAIKLPMPLVTKNAPVVDGCRIFPQDNPWNQDISKALRHWNSDAYIASIGLTQFLHPDFGENQAYGIPVTIAPADTKDVPIRFTEYGDESDSGPYPIPTNAKIEKGNDAHVITLHPQRCMLYELYNAQKEGSGWSAASGAIFNLNSNALRPSGWTSADAAGLPIYPGLIKFEEVAAGKINHAIRFTSSRTQKGYIHPATHFAGISNANLPPMGLRVRLKSNFDISKLSGQAKVIAEAMKTYGLILADNGSSWFFQGATDPRWKDEELNQLKTIPGSAFEAVETGPILK